jgi:3-oxoacyl-[acyl-carrier protein] reductase
VESTVVTMQQPRVLSGVYSYLWFWATRMLTSWSSMGKNLSTVLAGEGVTVNAILPAMIGFTDMIPTPKSTTWTNKTDLEELKETDPGLAIAASVPVRRLGHPQEVANVAVMMAKTGYLTGQDILLSGGLK